jgi:hypothetical protein
VRLGEVRLHGQRPAVDLGGLLGAAQLLQRIAEAVEDFDVARRQGRRAAAGGFGFGERAEA